MKKQAIGVSITLLLWIIALILVVRASTVLNEKHCEDIGDRITMVISGAIDRKIEIDQIWIYKSPDPFNPLCSRRLVLDVKDGYVQYKDIDSGYKHSTEKWIFLKNSHLKTEKGKPKCTD